MTASDTTTRTGSPVSTSTVNGVDACRTTFVASSDTSSSATSATSPRSDSACRANRRAARAPAGSAGKRPVGIGAPVAWGGSDRDRNSRYVTGVTERRFAGNVRFMEDEVLHALDELAVALKHSVEDTKVMLRRADALRRARRSGLGYRDVVSGEQRPLIVEMLRDSQDRVVRAGSRFRRAEARALRAEGLTLDEIARLFGVTRQRVIALLREAPRTGA